MEVSLEKILNVEDDEYDSVEMGTGLTKRERMIVQNTWLTACGMGKSKLGIEIFYE